MVGGGVRSGKSAFALRRAMGLGARRVFVATAQPFDDEMRDRIARHQAERAAEFATIEEPLAVPERLAALTDVDVVLIDCLTLWLSNLLLRGDDEPVIAAAVARLAEVLATRRFHVVLVTNEVGMGIVPESALGRLFRDVAGRAHQELAACADEVYFAALGLVLKLKPSELVAAPGGEVP
ncbi:MAG: bifunctional adenosylcobinamide kinase/adenosylcobinamide-phosphate guanylyltransferase [Deltaproteobacteria bacterium]|nr:bifunctional adenosylcobinamide kinase/adenosylcobinamide-phosphate guanylyltransferase [Deltaproteobacteria bacterium]